MKKLLVFLVLLCLVVFMLLSCGDDEVIDELDAYEQELDAEMDELEREMDAADREFDAALDDLDDFDY